MPLLRLTVLLFGISVAAGAFVPSRLEPEYADAVLAYHDGEYVRALSYLESLLRSEPEQVEFLQLQALTFKALGRTTDSLAAFDRLLSHLQREGKPKEALAPYQFELGVLAFQMKRSAVARQYLASALESGFNVPAAHFFLGLLDWQSGNLAESSQHLQEVIKSPVFELKPAAYLHLGWIAGRRNDTKGSVIYLTRASELAKGQLARLTRTRSRELAQNKSDAQMSREKAARDIATAADSALSVVQQSRWFGHVALSTAYDSNVLTLPITLAPATGAGSLRETLLWGLGYASAPGGDIQLVPSYHGSINYNVNAETRVAQFFANTASLYIAKTLPGKAAVDLKIEGDFLLGYSTDEGKFAPFSMNGSIGPLYRRELGSSWSWQAEAFFHPQKYYNDSLSAPSQARSGWGVTSRFLLSGESMEGFWNPEVSVAGDLTQTSGTEFRSKSLMVSVANNLHLTKRTRLGMSASVTYALFGSRDAGPRSDILPALRVTASQEIANGLLLVGDVVYINDASNVDLYRYSRYVTSLALNYLL